MTRAKLVRQIVAQALSPGVAPRLATTALRLLRLLLVVVGIRATARWVRPGRRCQLQICLAWTHWDARQTQTTAAQAAASLACEGGRAAIRGSAPGTGGPMTDNDASVVLVVLVLVLVLVEEAEGMMLRPTGQMCFTEAVRATRMEETTRTSSRWSLTVVMTLVGAARPARLRHRPHQHHPSPFHRQHSRLGRAAHRGSTRAAGL